VRPDHPERPRLQITPPLHNGDEHTVLGFTTSGDIVLMN